MGAILTYEEVEKLEVAGAAVMALCQAAKERDDL